MIQKGVSKEEVLDLLSEIEDNINICCAITMEPDEVLGLINQLKNYISEN